MMPKWAFHHENSALNYFEQPKIFFGLFLMQEMIDFYSKNDIITDIEHEVILNSI